MILEVLQGFAYSFSIGFFISGVFYFDLHVKKMRQELEAQRKFAEALKNKEFINEYLSSLKADKDEEKDSHKSTQDSL